MSAAHTEGLLTVSMDEPNLSAYLVGQDRRAVARVINAGLRGSYGADARRLAACWNAFEGVPTDKIEGKSAAEYVANESYLTGLVPIAGRGMEMGLSGDACQLLAESFAGQFKGSGGVNFIEVQMHHKDMGPFTVTIQRQHGETPAQQKAAALKELAAARALLQELIDIEGPQPGTAAWAEKVRAFLKGGAA